ncbi:MAG: DUF2846 domain-containing protein [Nitrospirales bacterium]|nr:DUF2846 domain-containing protein [Nitrospirales bacterium]
MSAEEESQAIIYLYRPSASCAALATPWVTLNGYKMVLLGNNQYTRLVVRPGLYMVQTERSDNWIDGQPDTLHFSAEIWGIYFLKISLQIEWHLEDLFLILCARCSIGEDTSKIEEADKSIAIPELKKTNFVSPL